MLKIITKAVKEKGVDFSLDKSLKKVSRGSGLLLHSGILRKNDSMHIMGTDPLIEIREDHWLDVRRDKRYAISDIFDWLTHLVRGNETGNKEAPPFCGGLMGLVNYDFKNTVEPGLFEEFPQKCPELHFFIYKKISVYDLRNNVTWQISQELDRKSIAGEKPYRGRVKKLCVAGGETAAAAQYKSAVKKIIRHILKGDVYQVNLSRKLSGRLKGAESDFVRDVFLQNMAPHEGYFSTGEYSVVSTSPETFFTSDRGEVMSYPVKGTIKRGVDRKQDRLHKEELLSSRKNLAELAMIVDLIRNDLSKVCKPGTVRVKKYPNPETYPNVHHLEAHVSGRTGDSSVGLLKAMFPGGSVTGCPKIKACQIIDELEGESRGPYTGAMGFIGWDDRACFNIMIRTILISGNKYEYRLGGGITLLSDPVDEYEETVSKGKIIAEALAAAGK